MIFGGVVAMPKRHALKRALLQRRKKLTEAQTVTDSSGNVFADLGLPNSSDELLRAELGGGGRSLYREEHAAVASDKPDVGSALMATENALRGLISSTLSDTYGLDWENKLGVKAETIREWRRRMEVEKKRLSTGLLDFRLLSFAEFGDLKRIITKNWVLFEFVFQGGQTEFEVFLSKLEGFRNPDAHSRGLLPFQAHLVQGICGHIRSEITRYRSRKDTVRDCFPQIESAFDNHGQVFPWSVPIMRGYARRPDMLGVNLRAGDYVEVVVSAGDPEDMPVEFCFSYRLRYDRFWQAENHFSMDISSAHIGETFDITCAIRSSREYHAHTDYDDEITFLYTVLPSQK